MSVDAVLAVARRLADDLLFPAAASVEQRGEVPRSHLDALADEGLYGLFAPADAGGLGVDPPLAHRVVEILASGCLSTAFVWLQHHGAVRAVAASGAPRVRETWLARLASGRLRAGIALGGLRPGPPSLRVRRVPGGYALDGEAPWVTGWGLVDVLLTAARDDEDTVLWLLLDARDLPVEPLDMVAVTASRTVLVRLSDHVVGHDRLVATLPFAEWPARDAAGLRTNGSLSLGVADRCSRLLRVGESEVDGVRSRLDAAGPLELPAARAAASELAVRLATTLVVATGASGILRGEHAQRLYREAAFLLVFGSRPAIKTELLRRLSHVNRLRPS